MRPARNHEYLRTRTGRKFTLTLCYATLSLHKQRLDVSKLNKSYLKRRMQSQDRRAIEAMLLQYRPLIHFPNKGVDFYNMSDVRSSTRRGVIDCRAVLDNNITSQLLSLISSGNPVVRNNLSKEMRAVCGIAAYLVHTGIEIIPELAHYERRRSFGATEKIEDDIQLRVIDHLYPHVLAGLFAGRINSIPEGALRQAKIAVKANELTQRDIASHEYLDSEQPGVNLNYVHLMRAWLLYKQEPDPNTRLRKYLDWSYKKSLNSKQIALFMSIFLSNNRLPRMIKGLDGKDPEKLLANIRNAAWDVFYLGSVETLTKKPAGETNTCWCLVTRDKLLARLGADILKITNNGDFHELMKTYYDEAGRKIFFEFREKVATRANLKDHADMVKSKIPEQMRELEDEIRATVRA